MLQPNDRKRARPQTLLEPLFFYQTLYSHHSSAIQRVSPFIAKPSPVWFPVCSLLAAFRVWASRLSIGAKSSQMPMRLDCSKTHTEHTSVM
jgi:hypothetical protein